MPAVTNGLKAAPLLGFGSCGTSAQRANCRRAGVLENPKLQFLGDVFATPANWPVHNVFSIGDFILLIGVFVLVHSACGSRVIPRRFRFTAVRSATA